MASCSGTTSQARDDTSISPPFDEKEVVIGIKRGTARLAVPKAVVRRRGAVMATMGGSPVAVLYDPHLDVARADLARGSGQALSLAPGEGPGLYVDRSSP